MINFEKGVHGGRKGVVEGGGARGRGGKEAGTKERLREAGTRERLSWASTRERREGSGHEGEDGKKGTRG